MAEFDFAHIGNADYVDQIWSAYREDPLSVGSDWRAFFAGFEFSGAGTGPGAEDHGPLRGADALVTAYRRMGHLVAHLAPISYGRPPHPLLDIAEYGLTEADLDAQVGSCGFGGTTDGTLRDLIEKLQATYPHPTSAGHLGMSRRRPPKLVSRKAACARIIRGIA